MPQRIVLTGRTSPVVVLVLSLSHRRLDDPPAAARPPRRITMKPKPEPDPDLCAEWELQRDLEQELADAPDDDAGRRESAP